MSKRFLLVPFSSGDIKCNQCKYLTPDNGCYIYGPLPLNGRGEALRGHGCLGDEAAFDGLAALVEAEAGR